MIWHLFFDFGMILIVLAPTLHLAAYLEDTYLPPLLEDEGIAAAAWFR